MSNEQKELKVLSKELLQNQIASAEDAITKANNAIQQHIGVIGLAKHILSTFDLPEKNEAKKPELEVK